MPIFLTITELSGLRILQSLLGIFTKLRLILVPQDGVRFGEQVPLLTNSIIRHNVLSEHISWGFEQCANLGFRNNNLILCGSRPRLHLNRGTACPPADKAWSGFIYIILVSHAVCVQTQQHHSYLLGKFNSLAMKRVQHKNQALERGAS